MLIHVSVEISRVLGILGYGCFLSSRYSDMWMFLSLGSAWKVIVWWRGESWTTLFSIQRLEMSRGFGKVMWGRHQLCAVHAGGLKNCSVHKGKRLWLCLCKGWSDFCVVSLLVRIVDPCFLGGACVGRIRWGYKEQKNGWASEVFIQGRHWFELVHCL